jgi:hypothetical protein
MRIVFTVHAGFRIRKRKISPEEIIETLKWPEKLSKRDGKYYAQRHIGRGRIEIVCEKTENYIKIVTVYWV